MSLDPSNEEQSAKLYPFPVREDSEAEELQPSEALITAYRIAFKEPEVEQRSDRVKCYARAVAKAGGLAVGGAVLSGFGSLIAIAAPGGQHIEIAGQHVSVRPEIGHNTSTIAGVAVLRDHARILHKNIGVNVNGNVADINPTQPDILDSIEQIGSDPAPEKHRVMAAAEKYTIERALIGGLPIAGLYTGSVLLWRRGKRKKQGYTPEIAAAIRDHNRPLRWAGTALAGGIALGLVTGGGKVILTNDNEIVTSDPQLLQAGIHGVELKPLAAKVAPIIAAFFPSTKKFYDKLDHRAAHAIHEQPMLAHKPGQNITRFGTADDFQSTNGMARVIGGSFRRAHVNEGLVLGDWTYYAQSTEDSVFDSYQYSIGKNISTTTEGGPHDPDAILALAEKHDLDVTDNKTQNLGGVSVLSLTDPRVSLASSFGHGYEQRDPNVTVEDFINQAVDEISKTNPQIVTIHDYKLALQIIAAADKAGCPLNLVITARSYEYIGPEYIPNPLSKSKPTTMITLGSGGGHNTTEDDPGIIQGTATAGFLDFDRDTGSTYYYVETAKPDGSFTVTPPINTQVLYEEFLKTGRTEPVGSTVTYRVPFSADKAPDKSVKKTEDHND